LLLGFLGVFLFGKIAHAEVTVPQTGDYVVDTAHVLDAKSKHEMEGWLRELEDKTGAQVKVLTVPTIDGEDFFGFVQRHYDLWKLGQKKKDNGALIVLAVKEHRIRIHTGYGLEGALPDSWCGSLSRDIAQEYFKRGAYGPGLVQMTVAVANQVADDADVKLSTPQVRHHVPQSDNVPFWLILLIVAIVIIAAHYAQRWGGGRRGFGGMMGPFPPSTYGGGWGGSSFGGSWGGGSSGGGSSGGGSFGGGSWGGGGSSGGGGGGASW
jgi:uncharacterized protein